MYFDWHNDPKSRTIGMPVTLITIRLETYRWATMNHASNFRALDLRRLDRGTCEQRHDDGQDQRANAPTRLKEPAPCHRFGLR